MKERKNVFAKETVTVCDKCSGHMMYKGGGCYVCESCGEEYLTDFGKVKRFINTYGPSRAAWQEKHPVKKVFIMRWQTVLLTSRKVR